jgi:hypothetical protein
MLTRLSIVFFLSATLGVSYAVEQRPTSENQIRKAVERGAAIRNQTKLQNGALHEYALVMKIGDVRCGHATVKIEDAKGDGGATYRLVETFKAAMAEGDQSAVVDYSGTFLLGPDLGLISGKMSTQSELQSKDANKQQKSVSQTTLKIADGKLIADRVEAGETAPVNQKIQPLHGVRPIPKNALLALTVFAVNEKQAYSPDLKDAFCIPALDFDWESNTLQIEPAWIVFDAPVYTNPKGTALQMRLRYLAGEVTEKGLEVEPPAPQVWQAQQTWPLDEKWRPLAHPAPSDPRVKVQGVDPATLDANAPLDLEKIRAAASKP